MAGLFVEYSNETLVVNMAAHDVLVRGTVCVNPIADSRFYKTSQLCVHFREFFVRVV